MGACYGQRRLKLDARYNYSNIIYRSYEKSEDGYDFSSENEENPKMSTFEDHKNLTITIGPIFQAIGSQKIPSRKN